jgi:hypothetical protein
MAFTNPLTFATIVQASSFQLISPVTGTVVASLSEVVPGTPSLDLLNGSALQWSSSLAAMYGPTPALTNPSSLTLSTQQANVFSGGGLGSISGTVTAWHDTATNHGYSRITADDGSGVVMAEVVARNNNGTTSAEAYGATVNLKPTTGLAINGTSARVLTDNQYAASTAAVSPLTTTFVDITGATVTINGNTGDIVVIDCAFDVESTAAGAQGLCRLLFNGVAVGATPGVGAINIAAVPTRAGATINYQQALGSSGAKVVKLQGALGNATTGVTFRSGSCTIRVHIYATK